MTNSPNIIHYEHDRVELLELAKSRGFKTIQDYLDALVAEDADEALDEMTLLREGFEDAIAGRILPIDEMFANLKADDED